MLRKCMLALAVAVSLVTPLALTTEAKADDRDWHRRHGNFGVRVYAPGIGVQFGAPSVSYYPYGYPYGYTYYNPYVYGPGYSTYVDAYGNVVYSPAPGPYPYYNRY